MPSRESKLIKNMLILGVGTLLPRAAVLVTLPIYTAILTKTEFGTYELINSLVLLVVPVTSLLLQSAAFRFLVECRKDGGNGKARQVISNVYCFVSATSLISVCVVFFFLTDISYQNRMHICLFLLLETLLQVTKEVVRGMGDNKAYTLCTVTQAVANVAFTVLLLLLFRMGLAGVLISLNIAMITALLSVAIRVKLFRYIGFRFFDKALLKEMLKYSAPLVPNIISIQVMGSTGRLLASAFIGIEATAVFGVAYRIPVLLGLVYSAFSLSWHESAFETHEDKDSEEYFSSIFNNLFNILSGLTAILIAATPVLFTILIRGDYDEAYAHIPILYMGVFFNCLGNYFSGIYGAEKKTWGLGIGSGIGAAVNLLLCLLSIEHIGLYAASVAMLIGHIVIFIYHSVKTRKWMKIDYNRKLMTMSLVMLTGMCILCYQRVLIYDIINAVIGIVFACAVNKDVIRNIFKKLSQRSRV